MEKIRLALADLEVKCSNKPPKANPGLGKRVGLSATLAQFSLGEMKPFCRCKPATPSTQAPKIEAKAALS
jgi:hypothetical protein